MSSKRLMHHDTDVDICLLLEGTYPYVRGGVSSWVHQIISGLPEYTFHLIFLGGHPDFYDKPAYEFPDNVVGFEMHYLLSDKGHLKPSARRGKSKLFQTWSRFLSFFEKNNEPIPDQLLLDVSAFLGKDGQLTISDFLYSRASWEVITERYFASAPKQSFVDYFWTYRNIYQPIFILSTISQNLPKAKVFHSVSTGYAGFLGALAKQRMGSPFLLTEHGIYTKERKIDLAQASWIKDTHNAIDISMHKGMDHTRKTWISFFEQLGLSAYNQADQIIALFEGNRQRQHTDGAPSDRTRVIVNGISTERFHAAYEKRPDSPPLVVGLVGRVVPIKDIKTFIRTIRGAVEAFPTLEGWIIGPKEEDPNYVHECELLIESLGLKDNVKMVGSKNVVDIMPQLGVMMLTSISEAQPLVLLEAMASGIPCIATEVGACREIIDGAAGEDAALGSAGEIIPIASPNEGAKAIIKVLSDKDAWLRAGDVGKARVMKYYDEPMMYTAYRNLYKEAIDGRDWI
ncbi:extracellular matrix protein PelF glycosyltransferase group 1 [Photobacterium aphoticum]|uniref:Extracellular matrix protein PelF glycosyltransferase group 1 n=1 Tax=Photobacterium aphoticum TaxID=754436 RepID=A0A090QML5_9GAMM|nr:extracellular matrix protein PelF glycosyltransferase group 1 [Photobacterium aphoticum]